MVTQWCASLCASLWLLYSYRTWACCISDSFVDPRCSPISENRFPWSGHLKHTVLSLRGEVKPTCCSVWSSVLIKAALVECMNKNVGLEKAKGAIFNYYFFAVLFPTWIRFSSRHASCLQWLYILFIYFLFLWYWFSHVIWFIDQFQYMSQGS